VPPASAPLGEFEVVVLLAVLHLNGGGTGAGVLAEIERRSLRRVSRGAVYITLDRLEDKALLASRFDQPSAARGGRPRRFFRVTPHGLASLKRALALVSNMRKGLEPLLGDL
jgi:DNA-binding PadR family transcriptional regulator